jgi:SAM-dependent methyltransferase
MAGPITDPAMSPLPSDVNQRRCPETLEELGSIYDANYYKHGCGPFPYDRTEPHWARFFGQIAARLIESLKPRRVLDAGCAMGFLVEAFWDRGVEAWGIDISPFAIENVRRDMREYCRVASISTDIEGTYDLITCIEVLEHMRESDAQEAIRRICAATDTILFSSTPTDLTEPTHFNVRPLLYWMRSFQENGFAPDLCFDAGFVTPHAMLMRRSAPWHPDVLQTMVALLQARASLVDAHAQISALNGTAAELERLRAEHNRLMQEEGARAKREEAGVEEQQARARLDREVAEIRGQYAQSQQQIGQIEELANDTLHRLQSVQAFAESLRHKMDTQFGAIDGELSGVVAQQRSMLDSRIWRSLVAAGAALGRVTHPFSK